MERFRERFNVVGLLREWGLLIVIAAIIIVAAAIRPAFLSVNNLLNILRQYSTIGIASIGMTFAVIAGGMDLSLGSTVSLTSVISMLLINSMVVDGVSPAYSAVLVLLAGMAVGMCVGMLIGGAIALVNGRMGECFIISFAVQLIVAALAQAIIQGQFQTPAYRSGLFKDFGIGMAPILFFLIIAVVLQFVLSMTSFGRNLYFMGANMDAAKMAGIKVKKTRIITHSICGMCAGITGVLIVSRVNSASAMQGLGYELDALACVAVGGTSLMGGNGSVLKTVIGVLVIGVLLTALNVIGVHSFIQLAIRGSVIVIAVILDSWNKRLKLQEVAK